MNFLTKMLISATIPTLLVIVLGINDCDPGFGGSLMIGFFGGGIIIALLNIKYPITE